MAWRPLVGAHHNPRQRQRELPTWGFISDVHGNLPALEQALDVLAASGARRLAFLGDYLGRGDPDACVRLIRGVADVALVGNRDLDWRDRVGAESRAWVSALPTTACVDGLLLAHGDPRLTRSLSTSEIRGDFQRAWAEMERAGAWLLAFGHSHHARIWEKTSADAAACLLPNGRADRVRGVRYLLNVGTTGLPFPGKGAPSVATVDTDTGAIRVLALPGARMPS